MPEITRRRLLGQAAAGAGGMLASSLLPPALARAAAAGPRSGSLQDVKHVVIQMQENRSFDHYFGTLSGVRGFSDPTALTQSDGKSIFYQPDSLNPDGYLLPWHLNTWDTSAQAIPSTSHAWAVQHQALDITVGATPGAPTTAANDAWLAAHLSADGDANGPYTMGDYERQDIPFHFALAETFTVCDGYHCSLLGPTWPNRMYLMTGTIDPNGLNGGPMISNVVPSPATGEPYTWTTYPEMLTAAGISWRVYQEEDDYGCNPLKWFDAFQSAAPGSTLYSSGLEVHPHEQFEWDCEHGTLPTVSWIIPTSGQSEHPSFLPAAGANFLASRLNAVAADKDVWNSTVFVVNYDENDGLFDHVVPPLPPAGTADEFVQAPGLPLWPIGGGVRVPAFVVSPWTVGGYVAPENFDHTSVIQLLEQVTGVINTNISSWRREAFGDLTSALGFSGGKRSSAPALPSGIADFWLAEAQVQLLPQPQVPGAVQTPPVQHKRRPRRPWGQPSAAARERLHRRLGDAARAMPVPASRLVENRTTHRQDFVNGASDKVYLQRLAAVEGNAVSTATGPLGYIPGITGGVVAIVSVGSSPALVSAVTSGTSSPLGVASTPDGTEVWVTESGANTVSVIDTSTQTITSTIVVGIYPHGIAISPDGLTAYVANTGPNTGTGGSRILSVISTSTKATSRKIEVGEGPKALVVSPDSTTVAVTCSDGLYAVTAATGTTTKSPVTLQSPLGVAVTPDGSELWVVDSQSDAVVIVSTSNLAEQATIAVGDTPWRVAISTGGSTAYVTNTNDDTVSVIDVASRKVTATIALGSFTTPNLVRAGTSYTQSHHMPTGVAVAPDGSVWVTCNVSSSLAIIDPTSNTVTSSLEIGLGDSPATIAFVS